MAAGWGALLGAGAALLGGFFTGGVAWGAVPVLLGAGAAAGAGVTAIGSKILKSFGDTPANQLQQLTGIPPEKMYEESKKFREDHKSYLDELNKKDKEEIEDNHKKVEKLQEEKVNLAQKYDEIADKTSAEAKATMAAITKIDQKVDSYEKRNKELKGTVEKREEKVSGIFKELGDPNTMTKSQFTQYANNPNLSSWKNRGIIAFAVILGIMLVVFIKKILDRFANALK